MPSSIVPPMFLSLLQEASFGIWYAPLTGEPDPAAIPFLVYGKEKRVVVPSSRDTDPSTIADNIVEAYPVVKAYVLIPGQCFDRRGTRHGRGGGWYDRFLSSLPEVWVRIGVLKKERLSDVPLARESWDEPVDWLLVQEGEAWQVVETGARKF